MARSVLLVAGLALMALTLPWPWSALWLVVPAVVAGSLLSAWRYGRPALVLPAALSVAATVLLATGMPQLRPWHVLWIPAASFTGAWMGLREEGGGPLLGERAWMHVPLLLLAFALPFMPGIVPALERFDARMLTEMRQVMASMDAAAVPEASRRNFEQYAGLPAAQRVRMLLFLVPNVLFLWMVALVAAGRSLAARIAAFRGWPPVSRAPFTTWRLPDPALVPLLGGLALALFGDMSWHPGATALLVQSVLGYSVQGVSVVQSLMVARGVPFPFVLLMIVFLVAFTLPVFLPSVALVGLGDVWLDFRRLEPSPRGEA